MKRIYILLTLILLGPWAQADEGMWLVNLISRYNIKQMKHLGGKLSSDDIYSINHASLKDAIVAIDHGSCTGELVSAKGLMFTNYHCAFDDVQMLSSLEHDYLKNGFWASNSQSEINIPGKSVSLLVKVEDVTQSVKDQIKEEKRKGKDNIFMMRRIFHNTERALGKESDLEVSVSSMFDGNQYYAYFYRTYKDVRLVGVPPSSIGMFGGDTDNWNWPQHKADFSVYRVYTGKDGKPAEYSASNVPLTPKYVLPISTKGVGKGDFTMVMGYPGSTHRFTSSFGIKQKMTVKNPAVIDVRTAKLDLMRKAMSADESIRIKYSSKYFGASNYWKFAIGESKYLGEYEVVAQRQELEKQFAQWTKSHSEYANVLDSLKYYYEKRSDFRNTENYFREAILGESDILKFSMRLKAVKSIIKRNGKGKALDQKIEIMRKLASGYYKDYDLDLDRKLLCSGLQFYMERVNKKHLPSILTQMYAQQGQGSYQTLADYIIDHSMLSSKEKLLNMLDGITIEKIDEDPAFALMNAILDMIYDNRKTSRGLDRKVAYYRKMYQHGMLEMQANKFFAPDANSTMRFTYGQVGDYSPADAVHYDCVSCSEGYLQKGKSKNPDYALDGKLKKLLVEKDFGPYSARDGKLYTGFISNNDITGGNSGSPVINARGEMVGLAYDGNWESMAGDIYFHPTMNKTVCVDIRFVLWIIDKYAHQNNLLKELQVRK